jgi:Icc-related predicted phosphoesterase
MTILHVTDFHFNKRWFDWLLHRAPPHDLTVMTGDMLNLADATPQRKQIAWVRDWIDAYPRLMCLCSGNHDLEWDAEFERWTPAYWLREIGNANVWTDGQRVELNGVSILNIGCTTRPKGGEADIWVVHAAPNNTLVTARATGGDGGDPDLGEPVRRYAPRLVLSGHVHDPMHWREHHEPTTYLNPGRAADALFPNHILVRTDRLTCQFEAVRRLQTGDVPPGFPQAVMAESPGAEVAMA